MKRRRQDSHNWVYILWGINGAVVVCLLFAALFYFTNQRASASDAPLYDPPSLSKQKPAPTSYFLPTLTPNPFYTPPPFETSTPFVLQNGPHPGIIGLSLAARPIDVYTFGTGERQYLIVAGIHGGYDWNTVALANEFIT